MSLNVSAIPEVMTAMMAEVTDELTTTVVEHVDATVVASYDLVNRGQSLLETHPTMAIPYIGLLVMALTTGVIGHSMIVAAYILDNRLRILGNEFLLNLALADLCVTGIADPMCLLGVTQGQDFFDRYPWLCEWVASLCLTACFCTFFSLTLTTFSRYMFICHNAIFYKLFTRARVITACVLAWVLAILLELPNYLIATGHFFDEKSHQCIWNRKGSRLYTYFVGIVLVLCPLLLNAAGYLAIFFHIYRSKRRIFAHSLNARQSKEVRKTEWKATLRATRATVMILVMFCICWTPYTIVILIDYEDKLSLELHLWVTFLAHLHSAGNVFIFAVTHSHFRETFLRLPICSQVKRLTGKGSDDSGTSTMTDSTDKMAETNGTVRTRKTTLDNDYPVNGSPTDDRAPGDPAENARKLETISLDNPPIG